MLIKSGFRGHRHSAAPRACGDHREL